MSAATLVPLAHHSLIAALPFFVPMVLLIVGIALLVIRDRRRPDDGTGPPD